MIAKPRARLKTAPDSGMRVPADDRESGASKEVGSKEPKSEILKGGKLMDFDIIEIYRKLTGTYWVKACDFFLKRKTILELLQEKFDNKQ